MKRLLLALLVLVAGPVAAQRTLVIERFDARIAVNRDGSIDVTETLSARFSGSWNGIFRTIPVVYRTPQGFNWTIRLDLKSVTDDRGQPLRVEQSRERHNAKFQVWVPGAVDATRTVVISYRATNALRFFDEHDELYWNVTGDEWEVPIEAASALITLPTGAEAVRAIAFNGAYGSIAQEATVATDGPEVRIAMPHALAFHEGLTAVVGWNPMVRNPGSAEPARLVERPSASAKVTGFLTLNWPLLLPLPFFFGMLTLWRRRGRDPDVLPVVVRYQPPEGLTPGEAGTLVDNSADMRDITATLVNLAVEGHLRIEERKKERLLGLWTEEEFAFVREPKPPGPPLPSHEQRVLDGVFDGGKLEVELSELENEFYTHLPQIKSDILDRLVQAGYYGSRPDKVQATWVAAGVGLGAVVGVGGSILADQLLLTPVPFIVAGVLVGLIGAAFGVVMPARTVKGARAREQLLGFEEFLGRVERERYTQTKLTPEMFERFLPFAMVFGVEKKWAKAFDGMYLEPPRWYVGTQFTSFNAPAFTSRLGSLSTKVGSTMSSSPRSSGGSGFSGGGSSGGGGGGGGGGGF